MSIKNHDGTTEITESILNFVDLAGSEKITIHDGIRTKKTNMQGLFANTFVSNANYFKEGKNTSKRWKSRINESKHINKSLFFLT